MTRGNKRKHATVVEDNQDDINTICTAIEKKAKLENIYEAKSLLLFGTSLFPESFKLKFLKYKLAKQRKDLDTAASALRHMYSNCPNDLYNELTEILDDVRFERSTINQELFCRLPGGVQHDILRKFTQTMDSPLDKATLLLVVMRISVSNSSSCLAAEECSNVMSILTEAEDVEFGGKRAEPANCLNVYRMRLACDLLPLVHQARKGLKKIDKRQLEDLVLKTLQFYLTFATMMECSGSSQISGGLHSRLEDPWQSLRYTLDMASDLLKWSRPLRTFKSVPCDQVDLHLQQNSRKMSIQELGCVYWSVFAESIMTYLRLARPCLFSASAGQDSCDTFLIVRSSNHDDHNSPRLPKPDNPAEKRLLDAYRTASRLHNHVAKDLARIAEKVEPRLRQSSWTFDRLFLLDMHLTTGNWSQARSDFSAVKHHYPRSHRELLAGYLSQCNPKGDRKKAARHLIECLLSLPESSPPSGPPPVLQGVILVTLDLHSVLGLVVDWLISWLDHEKVSAMGALCALVLCQRDLERHMQSGLIVRLLERVAENWEQLVKVTYKWLPYLVNVDLIEQLVYVDDQQRSDMNEHSLQFYHECVEKMKTIDLLKTSSTILAFLKEEKSGILNYLTV